MTIDELKSNLKKISPQLKLDVDLGFSEVEKRGKN